MFIFILYLLQDTDDDVMKQVIQCEGKREVWFRGRIQAYKELAQGLVPDRRQKKGRDCIS